MMPPSKRVLLHNQAFYPDASATSQHLTDLAIYLKENGWTVSVVTDRRAYDKRFPIYPARETYQGIEIHRVASTGFGKRSFFHRIVDSVAFELSAVVKLLLLPKQDVVVAFTSPPLIGVLGALFCFVRGGYFVQWLMDVNPDAAIAVGYLKPRAPATRFLLWLFGLSLKRSDSVVVLDRWMKDKVVARGAAADRIAVVPPWPAHEIALPDGKMRERESPFRAQHGLTGKFVVLYSGNHSIVHPLDTLLEAALQLKDDPSVKFVFIGGGLRVQDVTRWVEKHRLTNVLQLPHQPRESLADSLSSADLHVVVMGEAVAGLVHTSKLYGILATGTPYVFIGPGRSHVADLLRECPYGYQVEHGKVTELITILRRAQALPAKERFRWEQENIRYVATHYAAKLSLDIFYKEVMGRLQPVLPPSKLQDQKAS